MVLNAVPSLHQQRAAALGAAVESLLSGASLTLTALGRGVQSTARTKHNIKRIDRLLGNPHLHQERQSLYQALCHRLCQRLSQPIILVDWSDIVEQKRLLVIRAALAVEGRAIPLYEAVYPLTHYNTPTTHTRFLRELQALLPAHCRPLIVTDAGFRRPWFAAVERLGWYWLGRARGGVHYRLNNDSRWCDITELYAQAKTRARYVGHAELSQKRPYACHLYLYKKRPQQRRVKCSTRQLTKHSNRRVFAQQQHDPWLIATNLPPKAFSAKQIMALYGKRMQIEACFRDLTSDQYGFGLSLSRTQAIERLNILLLIAALATLCLWWVGVHAREQQWQRHFQANTYTKRPVLSVIFLGMSVLHRSDDTITMTELIYAHHLLLTLIASAHES